MDYFSRQCRTPAGLTVDPAGTREFHSLIKEKFIAGCIKPVFLLSNISKGFVNDKGISASVIVRKLGTLNDLLKEHGPFRDDVMAWAREEARLETHTMKKLHQRLIVTYSPKYALYQKMIRDKQVERAQKMIDSGSTKKNRKNPNDPARFIGTIAATKDGEAADIHSYLDTDKIMSETQYDGLYAVCSDLLDDDVKDILKVSEGRWQIEECFRIMKIDFSARPVYLQNGNWVKAHFLICFL